MTDVGVSAFGQGCGQLQSIDLGGCDLVTDVGASALKSIYKTRGVSLEIP